MIVCNQVMKYILDKIDKEEKQAAKKRKREESVEQKRSKQNATKLSALLFKHKEQLKAEILKKRALLDKDLQIEVQVWTVILKDSFDFKAGEHISVLIFISLLSKILRKHTGRSSGSGCMDLYKARVCPFYASWFSSGLKLPCFLKQLLINYN